MGKLAILTVIFKNYTILDDYFATLAKQTDKNFHVYVVDLTPEPQNYTYPSFVTCILDINKGYAYGINRGIKQAIADKYELFCCMNSDVSVEKHFVENITKSVSQSSTSLIGGKIYYAPGYEYHKQRYNENDKGNVLWYAGGSTDWKNAFTIHRGVDEVDKGQYNKLEMTTFITGCFMAFDKKVIDKLGFWDESYFLFYEDADFCARAMKASIPLIYDPLIIMWHKSGQSTSGAASTFQQKYLEQNRLKFGLKFAPWKTKLHLIKNYFIQKLIN